MIPTREYERAEAPETVPAPASEQEQKLAPLIERQRELNKQLADLARHDARRATRDEVVRGRS